MMPKYDMDTRETLYVGKYSCESIPHHIMMMDNIVGSLYDSSKSSTHLELPKLQWIN